MTTNYSEAVGLEGFEDIEGFELDDQEQKGIIAVDGILAHPPNLAVPSGAPGFDAKYGVSLMIPKGSEGAQLFFASGHCVLVEKWGEDSDREYDLAMQIASGFKGKQVNTNLIDGDQNEPEWNLGYWIATPKNEEPVPVLDALGQFIEDPNLFPKRNWAVRVFMELWAQPKRDRLNVRLLAVQGIAANARKVGRSSEQSRALVAGLVAKLPAIAAGQAAPRQAIAAQAAPPARATGRTRPQAAPAQPAAPARQRRAPMPPIEAEILPPEAPAPPARTRRGQTVAVEDAAPQAAGAAVPATRRRRGAEAAAPAKEDPSASFQTPPAGRRGRRVVVEEEQGEHEEGYEGEIEGEY